MSHKNFVDTLLSLNDMAKGILNRLYHLRISLSSPGGRPSSFKDPDLKKLTVLLLKSYPAIPPDIINSQIVNYQLAQQPLDPHAAYSKIISSSNLATYTRNILDELSDPFQTLLLSRNFQHRALLTIQSAPGILNLVSTYPPPYSLFTTIENSNPSAALLTLVCNYIKIHLSVHHIQERKQILVFYNLAFRALNNNSNHADFDLMAEFLTQCDTGMKQLQHIFLELPENIPKSLALILGSIVPPAINFCGAVKDLITRGTIDILEDIDSLPLPSSVPNLSPLCLLHANQTHSWIALILLAFPSVLVSIPVMSHNLLSSLKYVLSTSFVICIHRDLRLRLHDEYEELYSWWPPRSSKSSSAWAKACREEFERFETKPSKVVSHSAEEAIKTCPLYHREYRSYLIQTISCLLNMLKDEPGLLGPKIPVVLFVLNSSRLEIAWYFRHVPSSCPPPKVSTGVILGIGASDARYDPLLFTDNFISLLMNLHIKLLEHVKEYWWIVIKYQIEICGISHLTYFQATCKEIHQGTNTQTRSILPNIEKIIGCLSQLPDLRQSKGIGSLENFEERQRISDLIFDARNEWNYALAELQINGGFKSIDSRKDSTTLAASLSNYRLDNTSDILHRLAIFSFHAQFISEGESLLVSFASLGDIHFEKEAVSDAFSNTLNGNSNQLRTCLSFVQYLQHVMDHVHPYCPEEINSLGEQLIIISEKRMRDIQIVFERYLENYHSAKVALDEQLSSKMAAERFQLKKAKKKNKGFFNAVIGGATATRSSTLGLNSLNNQAQSNSVNGVPINLPSKLPGYESRHVLGAAVESPMENISNSRSYLTALCTAFGECSSVSSIFKNFSSLHPLSTAEPIIIVKDRQYNIHEFAREALFGWIRRHIRESALQSNESIERPSIILSKFLQVEDIARFVGDHIGIDYVHLIKLISLEEISGKDCGEDIGGVPAMSLTEAAQAHHSIFHNGGTTTDLFSGQDEAGGTNISPRRIGGVLGKASFTTGTNIGFDHFRHHGSTLGGGSISGRIDSPLFSSNTSLPRVSDIISGWIAHFIEYIVPSGTNGVSGIIFSEFFGGFIKVSELQNASGVNSNANKSKFQKIPRAEMWFDESELLSMLKLFGPRGLRVLDRSLLAIISTYTEKVQEILINEEKLLKAIFLSLSRGKHELALRQSQKFKQSGNNIISLLRVIGCTLSLRRLLTNTLHEVGSQMIPDIHRLLERAEQISNLHSDIFDQGKKRLNTLISFSGRPVDFKNDMSGKGYRSLPSNLDPSLSLLIKQQLGIQDEPSALIENESLFKVDQNIWSLFPISIAAAMCSESWKASDIILRFDALQNNNHTIALAVMQICDAISENSSNAKRLHKLAIHCSSIITMQMKMSTKEEKSGQLEFKDYCFPGMISFLQKLIDASSYTSFRIEEEGNNSIPYSLVHSTYLSRLLGKIHGTEDGMSADEFTKFIRDREKMIAENFEVDEQQLTLQTAAASERTKGQ